MPGRSTRRTSAPAPVALLVIGALGTVLVGLAPAARGEAGPFPGDSTTTTTGSPTSTTPPAPPPTTATTLPSPVPTSSSSTTSTTSTTATTQPGSAGGTTSSTSTASTTSSTSTSSTTAPTTLPPGAADVIGSVHRTPANSTAALMAALRPLVDAGMSPEQAAVVGFGRFPVAGLATFSDDWLMPRFTGTFHLHHGTDVFAAGGTFVRSPSDGVLRLESDPLGGTSAYVTEPGGTYYYLTHLAGYAPGVRSGQHVHVGDVIAFVGNTGDAAGGATHVHFEVHPAGGGPVDPKPILDAWIADALAAAPALVAGLTGAHPAASSSGSGAGSGTGLAASADVFDGPAVPARSQLLWATSASPAGGAVQLAQAEVTEAARSVDWARELRRQQLAALEWRRADAAAASLLASLMPAGLRVFMEAPGATPAPLDPGGPTALGES